MAVEIAATSMFNVLVVCKNIIAISMYRESSTNSNQHNGSCSDLLIICKHGYFRNRELFEDITVDLDCSRALPSICLIKHCLWVY